jgi:allophanate hydrolase subunit 2
MREVAARRSELPRGSEAEIRCNGSELPSEGMVRGPVQVPPGGQPVVFLADRPVTGGHPVVAWE